VYEIEVDDEEEDFNELNEDEYYEVDEKDSFGNVILDENGKPKKKKNQIQ
jgi:hypothetical protein